MVVAILSMNNRTKIHNSAVNILSVTCVKINISELEELPAQFIRAYYHICHTLKISREKRFRD